MIARAAVAGLKSLAIAVEFGAGAAIEILDRTARRLEPRRVLSPQPAGPPPAPGKPWTIADLEAFKGREQRLQPIGEVMQAVIDEAGLTVTCELYVPPTPPAMPARLREQLDVAQRTLDEAGESPW